ncbi:MAG: hypothetical protein A4S09_03595 [Proteobacteria bacterium SG_bin7]|nr:MAG: hypothetical protein A4S09_03595 [Proteobacteria bacterium SG_bin7]
MKKILIVDDSDFDRDVMAEVLKRKGEYEVVEARSAKECYDIISLEKVDLILLDILMPGTLGTDILKKIRSHTNVIELPVIMMTAKSDTQEVVNCLHDGANDFVSKPVNFDIMVSRIKTHLALSDLSKEMGRLKEVAALDAMIATYNHEINNPLTIAIGCLNDQDIKSNSKYEKLNRSLWRISEVVKKIQEITAQKVSYKEYAGNTKMVKI